MIIFIYGTDTFRSREKYQEILESYKNSNISKFDKDDFQFKKFVNLTQTLPFLAKERLIIIDDFFELKNKIEAERMLKFLDKLPQSTVCLFYERKQPRVNNKLYKFLIKQKLSFGFSELSSYELQNYVKKMANQVKLNISDEALTHLIQIAKNDLWKISNEIMKLANYEKGKIEISDVTDLVKEKKFDNIFLFIDNLARRDFQKASSDLLKLQTAGIDEYYILSMIVYQFRTLLIIKDLIEQSGIENDYKAQSFICSKAGISSYVVGNHIKYAKKYSLNELIKIYNYIFLQEVNIKNGKINPLMSLQLLVAKITL